jgi:hypothetical protein
VARPGGPWHTTCPRAAGALASALHARATTATIRDRLINVPARLLRSACRLTLHLPERWPWSEDFTQLFSTVHAPSLSDVS